MTRLIIRVWRTQPGSYFCISTRGKRGWRDHFFTRDELEDIDEFIRENEEGRAIGRKRTAIVRRKLLMAYQGFSRNVSRPAVSSFKPDIEPTSQNDRA